jgi:hypothetical protein
MQRLPDPVCVFGARFLSGKHISPNYFRPPRNFAESKVFARVRDPAAIWRAMCIT